MNLNRVPLRWQKEKVNRCKLKKFSISYVYEVKNISFNKLYVMPIIFTTQTQLIKKNFSLHLLTFSFYHLCGILLRFIFLISDLWPKPTDLELQILKFGPNLVQKAKIFAFDLVAFSSYHPLENRIRYHWVHNFGYRFIFVTCRTFFRRYQISDAPCISPVL